MAWTKGIQGYRYEYSASKLNKQLLELKGYLTEQEAKVYLYQFLRNNIGFASELLLGVKLFPFQCLLIKGMLVGDFSMFVLSRGMSKTFSAAIFVLLHLIFNQGKKMGVISSGFRQAKFILQKAEDILKKPAAKIVSPLFNLKKGTDQWELSCGRSSALALPLADGSRLRGFRFSVLLLDEFLNISKNIFQEVILPFLGVIDNPTEREDMKSIEDRLIAEGKMTEEERYRWDNNKLILLSSPSFTFEYMYEVYCLYRDCILGTKEKEFIEEEMYANADAYRLIFQLSYDCAPNSLYDKNLLQQAKATMSEAVFAKEFGAQFVSESDSYYKLSKMAACTIGDGEHLTWEICGNPDDKYIISVDPSWSEDSGSDDFAMEVFKLDTDSQKAGMVHAYGLAGSAMKTHIKYFLYLITHFNVQCIVLDYAGGVQFVSACNESELFKNKGIELKVLNEYIEGDFVKGKDYNADLLSFQKNLAPTQYKYCFFRKPSSTWIREGNELLQACIDHKKILFAGSPLDAQYEAQLNKNIPIDDLKWDRHYTNSPSKRANMIELLDNQRVMIELTKQQCANIEVSTNPQGSQVFRLPLHMSRITGPNKPRKDNYTALVLGNWMARIYFDSLSVEVNDGPIATFTPFVI